MNTWAPLWSGIIDSSLWEEEGDVVKVFVTMLAAKDSDHICRLDAYRIHKKCHIDEVKVLDILKLLASPDTRRVSPQEYEGRRIRAVEDGWLILNGSKYRDMVSAEMRKARLRRAQATFREKKKLAAQQQPELTASNGSLPGVSPSVQVINNQNALKRVEKRLSELKDQSPFPKGDPRKQERVELKTEKERLKTVLGYKA